jgi:hypothetical protein
MKRILFSTLAFLAICGCSIVGKNPRPPTTLESGIFNVTTNYAPSVTQYVTNGVPVYVTNIIPQYQYSATGQGSQDIKGVAGTIGALFGAGGIATTGVSTLLALWGYLRSSKNYQTAANTAQLVETMRVFIKGLPNGEAYDAALTQFMTQHQSEAGVLAQVTQILAREVSNPDAQVAADSVIATLRQLGIDVPQSKSK